MNIIRIIKNTVAAGVEAKVGKVLHLAPVEAKILISLGKAVAHAIDEDRADVIETRPVDVQTRQPVVKGRKASK